MKYLITFLIIISSFISLAQSNIYDLVKKNISTIESPDSEIEIIKSYDFNDYSYIAITKTKDSNGFPLFSTTQIDKKDLKIIFNSKGYFTDYKAFLFFFEKKLDNSSEIIILRIDHEWYTDLYAYINENDTLKEIGLLDVTLDPTVKYPSQDHLGFPIEEIKIKSIDNQIIFSFNRDLVFNKNDQNLKMKHNDFKYIYNGQKLITEMKN